MGTTVEIVEKVISEEYPKMLKHTHKHLAKSPNIVEDVVQDTVVKALASVKAKPDMVIDEPKAWLWRILRNRIIDTYRARARADKHCQSLEELYPLEFDSPQITGKALASINAEHRLAGDPTDFKPIDPALTTVVDYETDYQGKIQYQVFMKMLDLLTEGQKKVIMARYFEGMTAVDYAKQQYPDRSRIDAGNVVTALSLRGIVRLRELIQQPYFAKHFAT